MFNTEAAKAIVHSGMLAVVRRTLFTATYQDRRAGAFELDAFYQNGTGIVLLGHGTIYVLTPSHVIRNATANLYTNDSPFWVGAHHRQPSKLTDFMMPMRSFDFSPGGNTPMDAAFVEMNPMIFGLEDYLDWDDEDLFCGADEPLQGATAITAGYPAEVNEYDFWDRPDGSVQQVANVRRESFEGLISVDQDGTWFANFRHREGYAYPGLSGSVVVCAANGKPKYLGIVISIGDMGKRFKVLKFSDIRAAAGDLRRLSWEVLDEAYFFGHPTHNSMTYTDFQRSFSTDASFIQKRGNAFLEQLLRSQAHGVKPHWVIDIDAAILELQGRLRAELLNAFKLVLKQKQLA